MPATLNKGKGLSTYCKDEILRYAHNDNKYGTVIRITDS